MNHLHARTQARTLSPRRARLEAGLRDKFGALLKRAS